MTTVMAIFVISIILIMPIIICPFAMIGYWKPKAKYKIVYCIALALFFGIAGYCFKNPATNPDLIRYIQILHQYDGKTLFESFNTVYSNLFAVDVLFHFVSLLGDDQMLPAIATFLYYFIVLYIIQDYRFRSNIRTVDFIIYSSFVICVTIFCSIVNGIRWPLSYIIFILAVYRELIQGKKNVLTILLYAVSLLLHFSAIVMLIVRLMLFIKNKKIVVAIGAMGALVPQLISLLTTRFGSITTGIGIIDQLIYSLNRSNMYFQWNQGEWADIVRNSRYYRTEAFFYYIIAGLLIFSFIYLYKKRDSEGMYKRSYASEDIFSFYLMIATIISFTMSAHTYIRFITPTIVCFSFVVFKIYKEYKTSLFRKMMNALFVMLSVAGLFLNMYQIRTMIDLPEYISDILTFGILNKIIGY